GRLLADAGLRGPRAMRWIPSGLALLTAFGPAIGLAQTTTPAPDVFDVTDTNHDGKITPEEYRARMVEVFYLLDRNKDGFLTKDEIPLVSDAAFRAADKNGDGKLTLEEYIDARMADFPAADKAHKGYLTREDTAGQ